MMGEQRNMTNNHMCGEEMARNEADLSKNGLVWLGSRRINLLQLILQLGQLRQVGFRSAVGARHQQLSVRSSSRSGGNSGGRCGLLGAEPAAGRCRSGGLQGGGSGDQRSLKQRITHKHNSRCE